MSELTTEIKTRFQASFDALKDKRLMMDNVEELFHGEVKDAISSGTKSKVSDPRLSTLIIERSYRVMSQLAVGKVRGISSNDMVDAAIKNLLLEKYVIPNANAQFDLLTKFRLVDMYSNIYGSFFALVDWDVKPNGYIGPDMWLLNIRDVFPQVGAVSLEDSDYVIVRTWQPISYFEGLAKQEGFKNLPEIISKLKDKAGSKHNRDSENISKRNEGQYPQGQPAKGAGYFEVLSQYEGDRWSEMCIDADLEFRDAKNPHDNGELPIVQKYALPLLDDFMGLGTMERGASMQKVINSNWNLYLDALKMSMMPPVMINKDNIASMSSIKWGAAEKWLVRNQIDNAAKTINLTPQGVSTFNTTHQIGNAALLSLLGTSDTAVSNSTDTTMGKTPQALKMQQARESTGDNADKFYMERFVSAVMKKMVNLLEKKQPNALTIRMFEDEIENLTRNTPELEDMYDREKGKLTVKKGSGDNLYDWEIVSGSTFAVDKVSQQENIGSLISLYLKSQTPQGNTLTADLDREGYTLKFGELFKRVVAGSGIQDWDKILIEKTEQEKADAILDQDAQAFQNMVAQMQQGGGNMNSVPPQPNMMQPDMMEGMPQ